MKKLLMVLTFAAVVFSVGVFTTGCVDPKGYENISPEKAVDIMEEDKLAVVIDTRTEAEYKEGHIPGALLIPSEDIMSGKLDKLPKEKDRTLLLYCRTGRRAEYSAAKLAKEGYTSVYNFGGIVEWMGKIEKGE